MIEINLLPEELKLKAKAKKIGLAIEPKRLLYFIPLIFGLLIIIHICLAGILAAKNSRLNVLNNKWQQFLPQRKSLEDFRKEYAFLSADAQVIQQLQKLRINWSDKLNKMSLYLPSGIWFNEISVSPKDFSLKASVVSLEKEEMGMINEFVRNLKNDAGFFKDFNNLELSSIQRKVIGGYDIIDFILAGTLKPK